MSTGSQPLPSLPGIPKESAEQIRVLAGTIHRLNARIAAFESGIRPEQVVGLKESLDSKVPKSRIIWTQPPMKGGRDLSADLTIQTPTGAGGVSSLDGLTGDVTLVAGTNIAIANNTPSPGDIRISSSGGGVTSLDGITGAVTLVAGSGISVADNSPSPGDITIASTGGSVPTLAFFNTHELAVNAVGPTANGIYLTPFVLPGDISASKAGIYITTASAGVTGDFGIYDTAGNLKASVGGFSLGTLGAQEVSLSGGPISITAGSYYAAWAQTDTSGRIGIYNQATIKPLSSVLSATSATGGVLPATITVPSPGITTDVRGNMQFTLR